MGRLRGLKPLQIPGWMNTRWGLEDHDVSWMFDQPFHRLQRKTPQVVRIHVTDSSRVFCSLSTCREQNTNDRSGTNQRRRDRGFNAAKRRAACLSHSCPRTMTVRSCFCRNGLRGAVKSSIGAISLCWSETFPSMQLILIELCVLVTNIFH